MKLPCFQTPLALVANGSSLGQTSPQRCPSKEPEPSCAPYRRPRVVAVASPYPPAYPQRSSSSGSEENVVGASGAAEGCTDLVAELTSPEALEEALAAIADERVVFVDSAGAMRERSVLVLVEAYAKHCRACIGVRRVFQKVAEQHRGAVRCFKFDAFNCGNLAQKLGVRGLPTFIVYKRVAVPGEEGSFEWKRIDHFSTSKRSVIEQNIIDNL
jgi:thiol-disulfide isomerase/thioredoxin